ncbi:MAG TPA: phosphatase PAP2 family protein [Ktedonobacteraceae bacterium]
MQQEDREENGLLSSCLSEARPSVECGFIQHVSGFIRHVGAGGTDRCRDEQARTTADGSEQAPVRVLETQQRRRRVVGCLLQVYAVQLFLFGLLAWFVHVNPILPLDVAITRSFQHNQAPWLRITMLAISYPGSSLLLPALVLLAVVFFWVLGLRLEAVWVGGLSIVSLLLNLLLKIQVGRPRPTANLVTIVQAAVGYSFPSGHVMAYLAYWGLLFSFGIILFTGRHWWRTILLITSAAFVVLIGPSRIYLGDHWASDVLGAYLIGGVLLGLAVGFYLPLKERGVLETPRARARMREKKVLRRFPTKGWF